MGDAEDDSYYAHLSYEDQVRFFCHNVCGVIMDELHKIFPPPVRRISRTTSKFPKTIYTVAKAATLIAADNKEKTMSTIYNCSHMLQSEETLEEYLRTMSESYFNSLLALGEEQFFLRILAYCGISSLIADYFYNDIECEERGQVCRHVFEEYMVNHLKGRFGLNNWNDLVEASMPLSRLYDTRFPEMT